MRRHIWRIVRIKGEYYRKNVYYLGGPAEEPEWTDDRGQAEVWESAEAARPIFQALNAAGFEVAIVAPVHPRVYLPQILD